MCCFTAVAVVIALFVVVVFAVVIACTLSTTHPTRGKCYENGLPPFARVVLYYYHYSRFCHVSSSFMLVICLSVAREALWQ